MTPQQISQQKFTEHYGYNAEQTVFAPGRVNIIGEHTDYNDGFVMPCAINYGMAVSFSKRDDSIWRVYAIDIDEQDEFDLSQDFTQSKHKWANYVRGVVKYVQEQ